MADQPPTNGSGAMWAQTAEGKAKLSAIAKDRHKNRPFNTKRIPEPKIRRLNELTAAGASIKEAAEKAGIGYSTAQRYLSKPKPKAPVKAKDGYHRLEPKQIKLIEKLLNAIPPLPAAKIADRAGCHLSSVYTYRKRMLNEGTENAVVPVTVDASQGIPARAFMELRHANKETWKEAWDERRELTNGEMFFTMAFRRMNSPPEE